MIERGEETWTIETAEKLIQDFIHMENLEIDIKLRLYALQCVIWGIKGINEPIETIKWNKISIH